MSEATATPTSQVPRRLVKLPPIGTHLPDLGGTFWALQRALPSSGERDYVLIVPHGPDFEGIGLVWGGYGHLEPGAACLWDGSANTKALVDSAQDHPAAAFTRSTNTGLYLPSIRELKALFANGCDAFSPKHYYWSSTQYGRYGAYVQHFGDGFTNFDGKGSTHPRCRPVRQVSIESLID